MPLHSLTDDQKEFYFSTEHESGLSSNDDEVFAAKFRLPISHTHHSGYSS